MKKYIIFFILIFMIAAISACGNTSEQLDEPQVNTTDPLDDHQLGNANSTMSKGSGQGQANSSGISGTLTKDEVSGLLFMREEEKLAHDVYMTLFDQRGLPIFQNIAASELTHSETVKFLLNKYEIPDPAEASIIGQFNDQDLQVLYDQLVEMGSASLVDALIVGTSVEEIDILDLEKYIAHTQLTDITQVYENLLAGSRNHLRSFVAMLERQTGETFQPQYLSPEAYQEIISGSFETVKGGGQSGNGKGPGGPNN